MSLALVLSLLLPLLLGLLPPLAPTEAFALERDLAASRCLTPEDGQQIPGHDDHDQCCILCPVPGSSPGVLANGAPLVPRLRQAAEALFTSVVASVRQHPFTTRSARGPPLA